MSFTYVTHYIGFLWYYRTLEITITIIKHILISKSTVFEDINRYIYILYLSLNLPTKRSSNKVESIPTAQVRRRRGSIQRILETFLKQNEQETVEKKKEQGNNKREKVRVCRF